MKRFLTFQLSISLCLGGLLWPFEDIASVYAAPKANCDCYFSRECGANNTCKLNDPDRRREETEGNICFNIAKDKQNDQGQDLCPRSNGVGVCDGVCMSTAQGTGAGCENATLVAQAISLWSNAFIQSALAGGGPPAAPLVQQALALSFRGPHFGREVARAVLDLMELSLGEGFVTHLPTTPHFEEDHLIADLSADACRAASATLSAAAFAAEFQTPGAGAALIDQIPTNCPGPLPFADPCTGPTALSCLQGVIEDAALALATCGTCDIDRDGDIDRNDLQMIFAVRNTMAMAGDLRDPDGDLLLTVNDVRMCSLRCTRPRCVP